MKKIISFSATFLAQSTMQIVPPVDIKPNGSKGLSHPKIIGPEESSPENYPAKRLENDAERTQRLQDAKIIPTPTPMPTPESFFSKLATAMEENNLSKDGEIKHHKLRTEINFGTYKSLMPSKGTKVIEDFSYGFNFYALHFPTINSNSRWNLSQYVGMESVFYNDGIYLKYNNYYNEQTYMYADRATTEVGPGYSWLWEKEVNKHLHYTLEIRGAYLFLRWLKTTYYSEPSPPFNSEAESHFLVNYLGFYNYNAIGFNWARFFSCSTFVSFSLATPTQLKFRTGLSLGLASPLEKVLND